MTVNLIIFRELMDSEPETKFASTLQGAAGIVTNEGIALNQEWFDWT